MTAPQAGGRRAGWAAAMALYLLGIFMGAIDTGIVTPARPIVARDLGVDESAGIWMITIYTLAYAAAIPVMGKLADRQGRKRIYLTAIAIFGVGSLLCGLAQDVGSFEMLIAARALQAIGGGGILPIATAEIGTEVPPEKRGLALGLVGMVFGIANIFGASAGSLILDIVGVNNWQWIFYVNVPIAIGIVLAGRRLLPDHRAGVVKPIDLVGTVLLVGIILSLLYGIKNVDFFDLAASVRTPSVWPFLVGCLVALPFFVIAERRAVDPVLNLRYFTQRGIGLTLLLSLLSGVVLMAVVFVPQLSENALRIPGGRGGYLVIVLGLASGIGAPLSGRLTDRFGAKAVLGFGMLMSAAAAATVVWWMIPHPSLTSVLVSLGLIGFGLGFVVGSPLNYMMLERTTKAESASALGTLSLVRSIGTTLAPAIMVGFIANGAAGLQTSLTAELPDKVAVAALPYAAELEARITRWRSDEKLAERLGSVALPDLTRTEITIDTGGGGELPDDLAELLRTADVTTITERTKVVARSMFEATTPATVREIQQGVDSGIAGLRSALDETATARQEMTDGLATMDANLAEMASGLAAMDSSLAEMATGIASMDAGLRDMGTAIPKMDASLAEMAAGLQGMDSGLAGLDAGIAGLAQPIAGLDTAIEGMEAGLDQQGAALDALRAQRATANPSQQPALDGQIAGITAAVTALEAQRDDAASQRDDLRDQLAGVQLERYSLAEQRGALSSARTALATQRAKLATGRAALATQRATLADGRAALSAERASLADGRASLAAARADLASARDELDATRTELADSIDKMAVLREAVPGAFDQALVGYLAEIDGRAPRIEATFAAGLGEGFRGVYLFDLAACLAALLVILAVPRGRIDPHHHDADDAVTVADRQPTTVPVGA